MGEEVEVAPLSAEAQELLEWLAEATGESMQEAAEMAAREGFRKRKEAQRRAGKVIPFRLPWKA